MLLRLALPLLFALAPGHAVARPASYAVWAADSAIARKQGNGFTNGVPNDNYPDGEFQWALQNLLDITGNQTYFNYIQAGADVIVSPNGTIGGGYSLSQYVLDPIRLGPTFLYLYEKTGEAKYKTASDTYRLQLDSHPRTAQGQFWHKLIYVNEGWLDGIYMGEVFYAQYTKMFQPNNATAWADITAQFELMFENTRQLPGVANYTGLMYHGYDFSHQAVWASPDRGHSPEVWIRALGWYLMALVDVLEMLPPSSGALKPTLLNILNTLAPNVRDAATPKEGVWWLVITQPGRAGNYFESSGAMMYVYSLLKAIRLGFVKDPDGSITAAMKKAHAYAVAHWVIDNGDGTMSWNNTVVVGSLNTSGDFAYYIAQSVDINDLKGLAAFVLASMEIERL